MVLAEIGNGYTTECHLAEIELSATFTEVVDWIKARDSHLADDLRGKWTYAEVYIIPPGESIDQKRHAMTLRNRHGALSRLP
jgi:hypothetical protein